jgi:hypothetical protein
MIWSKNCLRVQRHAGRNDFLALAPSRFITGVKTLVDVMVKFTLEQAMKAERGK